MLTAEQGAALHGVIAMALQDLDSDAVEVTKVRLRRLRELVDDLVPDVDGPPVPPEEITVYLLGDAGDDGPDLAGLVYDTENEAIEAALDNGRMDVWKIDGYLLPATAVKSWTNEEEASNDADE